jgi:bifunctional UDP-N-acetylglucosamine pyrophosphorylase / glucosamine-1-phosphate N-acetyltransferase
VSERTAAVIMAAGKSTRMKSAIPKAAHPICGKPVTRHIIDACREAGIEHVIVVVGYEAELVKAALGDDVSYALQEQQLGTGHACMQAMPLISPEVSRVLVLPGDCPLLTGSTVADLLRVHTEGGYSAALLTAILDDAGNYGRIVRDSRGNVCGIVEAKDATVEQLAICEMNPAVYCFARADLEENLGRISSNNAQGEYYLTDVIGLLVDSGRSVGALAVDDPLEALGINNRVELAEAASIMRSRILRDLMLSGVTIVDPATTHIDAGVRVGADTVIQPFTIIERGSVIGSGCEIGPFAHLRGVTVVDGGKAQE